MFYLKVFQTMTPLSTCRLFALSLLYVDKQSKMITHYKKQNNKQCLTQRKKRKKMYMKKPPKHILIIQKEKGIHCNMYSPNVIAQKSMKTMRKVPNPLGTKSNCQSSE